MSLIDGLILHTMDQANKVSQHSQLMKFYALDKEIDKRYDLLHKQGKSGFHDLTLYFMKIEATALLYALKIKTL